MIGHKIPCLIMSPNNRNESFSPMTVTMINLKSQLLNNLKTMQLISLMEKIIIILVIVMIIVLIVKIL